MKKLEELNAIDNFMFNELTMQEDVEKAKLFCRTVLEPIIGEKIHNIEIIPQKINQGIEPDSHGIQMDAYIRVTRDENGNETTDVEVGLENAIYDIEPNLYQISSEEKRARFYHSSIDSHIFKSGTDYKNLEKVVVIFILTYDPFGLDRMLYTIKRHCVEEPEMTYDDGDLTYFIYTNGTKNVPSQELKNMLSFLVDSSDNNATSENLAAVRAMMDEIKHNHRIGVKYMHTWEREQHIRQEALEQGIKEGIEQGIKEGIEQGIEQGSEATLIRLITAKLSKGKSLTDIANEIEEPESKVSELIMKYNL